MAGHLFEPFRPLLIRQILALRDHLVQGLVEEPLTAKTTQVLQGIFFAGGLKRFCEFANDLVRIGRSGMGNEAI